MGDVLTGVASIVGALGTIITVYLAYKIQVVSRATNGTLTNLADRNAELHDQVQVLLVEGKAPK